MGSPAVLNLRKNQLMCQTTVILQQHDNAAFLIPNSTWMKSYSLEKDTIFLEQFAATSPITLDLGIPDFWSGGMVALTLVG